MTGGETSEKGIASADSVGTLERIIFRTGPRRGDVRAFILDGEPGMPGTYHEDLPGADVPVPESICHIDNVKINIGNW
jgi:hypothetical protein